MTGQQRRRTDVLLFVAMASLILLETCVSAAPRRREKRRPSSWSVDHGGWDMDREIPPEQRSDLALPKTYRYAAERPHDCVGDDDLFADCYLCGKLAEDVRVYEGCCQRNEDIKDFCDKLLS